MTLDDADIARYREDGVLFPLPALDHNEVDAALGVLARLEALPKGVRRSALTTKSHLLSRTLWDIVHHSAIVEAASAVIGPDLLVWGAGFFKKVAGSPDFVSWHQDATYWGLEPPDIVTAWVALSRSTIESGCLRVVPGSHRWPILPHRETYADHNLLSRGQEIAVDVRDQPMTEVVLAPGQMSLHHVLLAHNSEPNRAHHDRIGFAIRYIGGHVRQTKATRDTATLVRGRNALNSFDLERNPLGEFAPDDLAYHAEIVAGVPHLPRTTG
ncbi:MAG: phytanoyl-CoA dioxygenase family protein, partial [Geminicoccaceae bacterium]